MQELTHSRVRERLDYDPKTGILSWKKGTGRRGTLKNGRAGTLNTKGYRQVHVDGKTYRAGRLIWFWMTGEWPTHLIDHINRDRGDDRWANLRQATHSENAINRPLDHKNKSGYKGVRKEGNRWRATIYKDYRPIHLGFFPTPEEVAIEYQKAAQKLYGEFAQN